MPSVSDSFAAPRRGYSDSRSIAAPLVLALWERTLDRVSVPLRATG
jgi:hypothetical protein